MNSTPSPLDVRLEALTGLFYSSPEELAHFREVMPADMPSVYHRLLAHEAHMTVTVEVHHQDRVDVEVLRRQVSATHYAREILLRRQRDRQVVQYGIMRVNFAFLSDTVRQQIEAEATPLGRVLIHNNVHRQVRLCSLWHVLPGAGLAGYFGSGPPRPTYGRTALILCDDEPAIELLEIVAPEG